MMKGTKISGSRNIIVRWLLSAVTDMTMPEISWVPT